VVTQSASSKQGYRDIVGTAYCYSEGVGSLLDDLAKRVRDMRAAGRLSPDSLAHIRKFFRVKSIYNSNAIEGNQLDLGETRLVVEQGLTITGKPLKDSAEARNLAHALDYFESLASSRETLKCVDIRQTHSLILKDIDDENAGRYRGTNVEISGSAYHPPPSHDVPGEMDAFCAWLAAASDEADSDNPIALGAAAHAWFVRIHPFADGNGRTARIIMNLILMRYGYPIAVITKDERQRYYDALEESQSSDLTPFIVLVAESVLESLEEYERAVAEQTAHQEWAQSLVAKFTAPQRNEAENYYEVWRSAMDLFKNYVRQSTYLIDEQAGGLARIYFADFGGLEFEKYLSLRDGRMTKRTWFFRVDFKSAQVAARYLFFFGFPSNAMSSHLRAGDRVTLHVATEITPFLYEGLDNLQREDLPDVREVGYNAGDEQFVVRAAGGIIQTQRVEEIVRLFFEQVVQRNFPSS
jgi:Fic family protein